jgi:hypothetical protein
MTPEFQMFRSWINAPLALPILVLTSASVPPCLSTILPRYVNDSISSSGSPFKYIFLNLSHVPFGKKKVFNFDFLIYIGIYWLNYAKSGNKYGS